MARPLASLPLIAVLAGSLLVGCAGTTSNITGDSGEPDWISRPNGVGDEGEKRAIYAVGSASYNPNHSAQRNAAIARARAGLARTMRTVVESLVKDYMSTNRDFYKMDMASSVEYYEDISRQVTQEALFGTFTSDTWKDPKTQEIWIKVGLEFDSALLNYREEMQASFEREAVRKRIEGQADAFERRLDEQIAELQGLEADIANRRLLQGDS